METFGAIWSYVESHGAISSQLEPFGAIWSHLVPFGANNFMAKIDEMIIQISQTMEANVTLKFLKRFLDDLFTIFIGSTKQ